MKIGREFYFDAAHFLPEYKGKCEQVHGHTYKLEVIIEGELHKDGMVMDFKHLKEIVTKIILENLDHKTLNDLFENPTAENIAIWIFAELRKYIPVCSITLHEGVGKWVVIEE